MNWYLRVIKKYAVFNGRARRSEYWFFYLFSTVISIILMFVDTAIGAVNLASGIGFLSVIYGFFIIIPGLSVTVRRLHDTDRSGWWVLIGIIPFIGPIVLFVFMVLDSSMGDNRFGPSPKLEAIDD
jgi:uncharacterized membrane protein YhaH (DUF805 family)